MGLSRQLLIRHSFIHFCKMHENRWQNNRLVRSKALSQAFQAFQVLTGKWVQTFDLQWMKGMGMECV
jgi:hypothetical protein